MAQASNRTIPIKNFVVVQEERLAKSAILPGMLLDVSAADTYFPHDVNGGYQFGLFAVENDLAGKGIDDEYAAGEIVFARFFRRGDVVLAILLDGENVAIGDPLCSAGNGVLRVSDALGSSASSPGDPQSIVGIAEEALDMSGSSGAESSDLAAHPRIKVRII